MADTQTAAKVRPDVMDQVATKFGDMEVGLMEPSATAPKAIAIFVHGKSAKHDVVWEWLGAACRMCDSGVAGIMPNLHSCRMTAPATADIQHVVQALCEVIDWASVRYSGAPIIVYGKSWGGAITVELATAASARVSGLVLACPTHRLLPDLPTSLANVTQPVLLLWARDDEVVSFPNSESFLAPLRARPSGERKTIFLPIDVGGHRAAPFVEHPITGDRLLQWPTTALLLADQCARRERAAHGSWRCCFRQVASNGPVGCCSQ